MIRDLVRHMKGEEGEGDGSRVIINPESCVKTMNKHYRHIV